MEKNKTLNDFVIVLFSKNEKELLENVCEKKNIPLFEYCNKAIVNALNSEVKV